MQLLITAYMHYMFHENQFYNEIFNHRSARWIGMRLGQFLSGDLLTKQHRPISGIAQSHNHSTFPNLANFLIIILMMKHETSQFVTRESFRQHVHGPQLAISLEMHRCLRIPELVTLICHMAIWNDDDLEGKRTVTALAQTCQLLYEPAANIIWYRISTLKPLVDSIPQEYLRMGRWEEEPVRASLILRWILS